MRHVLDGYKVFDFTQVLAGATCARLLAEMGAEVIKIELPPKGDFSRDFGAFRDGRSAYYIQQNRGRKSVCQRKTFDFRVGSGTLWLLFTRVTTWSRRDCS